VAEVTDFLRLPEEGAEDGRLIVQVEDTLAARQRRIPVDMVILSVGLQPQPDARDVARRFGITCSAEGWVIERHPKLDPVATMTEGVFAAGCALGPRDIPSSVATGAAAAARILARIQQREMALEPVRAVIDQGRCSGCRICNDLCPFSAIAFDAARGVTDVNPALCQGCGVCVAACPAAAISGTGFSDAQILGQIEGLLVDRGGAVTTAATAGRPWQPVEVLA
jgi:heterodisulfide reductase subunit A